MIFQQTITQLNNDMNEFLNNVLKQINDDIEFNSQIFERIEESYDLVNKLIWIRKQKLKGIITRIDGI